MAQVAKIDAHQHFWQIARGDYTWMTDEVASIRRDILPEDLSPILSSQGVAGTVVVQAAATVAETEFLLSLAEAQDFIKGIVGWVDLDDPDALNTLDQLMAHKKFKGLRPMLQDIEDTNWITRPTVMTNLKELAKRNLKLDALIQPRHLNVLNGVAEQIPALRIVIDHCAKPVIADGADAGEGWRDGMARLAQHPNVFCKLSGLANEVGTDWDGAALQPVFDHVLHVFGPSRIIWGSDWPVLNLVGDYSRWVSTTDQLLAKLSVAERNRIYRETAIQFYEIEVPA